MAGLLLDQNLSHRLVAALSEAFPGSVHVRDVGLARADDAAVWDYAKHRNLVIVSKDGDFHQMSFLYGAPPKVVWLRAGNCTSDQALTLLLDHSGAIETFAEDAEATLLVIGTG